MLLLSALLACRSTPAPEAPSAPPAPPAPEPAPAPSDSLSHTMKTVEKSDGNCDEQCARVVVSWPDFTGPAAEALNAWTIQSVASPLFTDGATTSPEEFAASFLAEWRRGEPDASMGWELERNVGIYWQSEKVIVLSAWEFSFTGGAHPSSSLSFASFDVASGRQLALSDVLVDGAEAQLVPLVKAALEAHLGAPLSEAGLDIPDDGNPPLAQNWAINAEGLTFFYNPYEIGPYVIGAPDAAISREQLDGLIRPGGPW